MSKKQVGNDVVLSWSANLNQFNWLQTILWESNGLIICEMLLIGNATTYTIVGGSLATEYALTAYNANITELTTKSTVSKVGLPLPKTLK
jgi:hypothetical protein